MASQSFVTNNDQENPDHVEINGVLKRVTYEYVYLMVI